jgi:alkaline phosphatase
VALPYANTQDPKLIQRNVEYLDGLRAAVDKGARRFTASSTQDITVPSGTRLAVIDFELVTSALADIYLRPNGNVSNILGDEHFTNSTAAPNVIAHVAQQTSVAGVRLAPNTGGAIGVISAVGRVIVQVRPSAGRRVVRVDSAVTNTAGSSNFYTYNWTLAAVVDVNIGAATVITFLRIIPSAGSITGTVRAVFT